MSVLKGHAQSDGLHHLDQTRYVTERAPAHAETQRRPRIAAILARHQIGGTHYTHIMRGDERIAPPYIASQTLVFDGSVWRFSAARYAIANDTLPFTFPNAGSDPDRLPFHPPGAGQHG